MNMPRNAKKRELIEQAIVDCGDSDGRITPEEVVRKASDPKNVLHNEFEWDNAKAGHQHRLEQARRLIRSVRVVVTVQRDTIAVPRYIRDQELDDDEQGYASIEKVQESPELAAKSALYELNRAIAYLARAKEIVSVLGVQKEVATVLRRAEGLRRKIEKQVAKD